MTYIFRELEKIVNIMELKLKEAINSMNKIEFYNDGKAKKAVDTLKKANERFLELHGHYLRMCQSIEYTLETMMKTDKKMAEIITAKLGL